VNPEGWVVSEFEADWYDENSAFQKSWNRFKAFWFGRVKCPQCQSKWPGTEEILSRDVSNPPFSLVTYVCPDCQHRFIVKKSNDSQGASP
jgi:uncharacterized protein YlaI